MELSEEWFHGIVRLFLSPKDSPQAMTTEEFESHLVELRKELNDEIATHYRLSRVDRGKNAYGRWKTHLSEFLSKHTVDEGKRFLAATKLGPFSVQFGESAHSQFIRLHGKGIWLY